MREYCADSPALQRIAAVVAAMALLGIIPATAQPVPLTPPAVTSPPAANETSVTASPQSGTDDGRIQVAPLQPVDLSWTGLNSTEGAFPRDMWNGTSRNFIATILPQLQPVTSPELDSLARRLLLSDAVPPAPVTPSPAGLLSARINRIYAFGLVTNGLALIESLPDMAITEGIDRDRVLLRFAANDAAGACRDVNERIARYPGPWWARALIACQALSGSFAKASLGLDLLIDEKTPADPEFDDLIHALSAQHPQKIIHLSAATPLQLALLAATKRPLSAATLDTANAAALVGYAGNGAVPPVERLAAAERAEALGALPPASLGALYGAIRFKPSEIERARTTIKPPMDARDRALLYVLAKSGSDFTARRVAIEELMADAERRGVFVPTARLLAPILTDIPSVDAGHHFSRIMARILLAAGKMDAARSWVDASHDDATMLLSQIAMPGVPNIETGLVHDAAADAGGNAAVTGHRVGLLYALLTALGVDPTTLDNMALTAPPEPTVLPNAALWDAQQRATQGKSLGATVLTTLLIAESDGHLTSEPIVLARAISGLRAVSLDSDAHALALEAALNAGM